VDRPDLNVGRSIAKISLHGLSSFFHSFSPNRNTEV
jgi:hypothetical protein